MSNKLKCENCYHYDVCFSVHESIQDLYDNSDCYVDKFEIENALEKQIPKKPIIKFGEKPVTHNYGRMMKFYCPVCKKFILAMYETDVLRGGGISNDLKGCPRCLQRIDFSGYYAKAVMNNVHT